MNELLKAFYKRIMIALAEKGKKQKWLAEQLKVSPQALSLLLNCLKKGNNVNTASIEKIEKVLEITFF